jgi:hypothetical protein
VSSTPQVLLEAQVSDSEFCNDSAFHAMAQGMFLHHAFTIIACQLLSVGMLQP